MSTDGDPFNEIIFVMIVTTIFILSYCSSHTYSSVFDHLVPFSVFVIFILSLGVFSAFSEKQRTRKE